MKILKNKTLFGIMIGLVIGSIGVVIADYKLKAKDVEYEGKNGSTNVQKAIEDLYKQVEEQCQESVTGSIKASGAKIVETEKDENGNLVGKTYYAEVYLNPSNLNEECDETKSASNIGKTGQKTGCMKWYAYNEREVDGRQVYDLILDHNTTAKVAWGDEYTNTNGPTTVVKELGKLVINEDNGGYAWQVIPRMITADEIAHIVGADREDTLKWSSAKAYGTDNNDTKSSIFYLDGGRNSNKTSYSSTDGWQKRYANNDVKSNYAWLYDYTYKCKTNNYGCEHEDNTSNVYGYWTSTKSNYADFDVWYVREEGRLASAIIESTQTRYGLRPVISIYQ